ncbi:hypothetical protein UlMin_034127 [Ulmus minor]
MRGLFKSKRVSWASDVNLCQVRLFLSEESPSQVGLDSQDHLQAKASWVSHSTGTGSDDILPPGFEGAHPSNQLQTKLSQIPTIKWLCPPRFIMNIDWQVVAGEESQEAGLENQREMRVLEAVYPRPSAIPPNASVLPDAEDTLADDRQTPSIPITPIEDEDVAADTLSEPTIPFNVSVSSQPLHLPPGVPSGVLNIGNPSSSEKPAAATSLGVEPDLVAAALSGLVNGNEHGNLIDHELLIKILSNPTMVEKLVTDYGPNTSAQSTPVSRPPPVALPDPPHAQVNRTQPSTIPLSATSSGPLYSPPPNGAGMGHIPNSRLPPISGPPSHAAAPPKDMSYYKSLIQQHGGDRQETGPQYGNRYSHQNPETANGHKARDSKPKIMKPCIYFNSSRGCRHGANCSYQHDASYQPRGSSMSEVQNPKRMKYDREISS